MARYTKIGFAIILGFFVAQIWGCSADTHVPIGHAKMRFPASELESIYGAMNEVSLEKGLVFSSETRRINGQVAAIAIIEKNGCVAALAYGYKINYRAEIYFYKCKAFDPGSFTSAFFKKARAS